MCNIRKNWLSMVVVACFIGGVPFVGLVTFSVILGSYAFKNPDAQAYYISDSAENQAGLIPYGPNVDAEGVTPIHDYFVIWFTWMFVNHVVILCCICFTPVIMFSFAKSPVLLSTCTSLFMNCCLPISLITAYIMGLVLRFSEAGKFASGDERTYPFEASDLYQLSNGRFLFSYYEITGILLAIVCLVGTCCGIALKICCSFVKKIRFVN